jgi:transposase-like protein
MTLRKDDDPMGKPPRKYSREFKIEAVKQVVE